MNEGLIFNLLLSAFQLWYVVSERHRSDWWMWKLTAVCLVCNVIQVVAFIGGWPVADTAARLTSAFFVAFYVGAWVAVWLYKKRHSTNDVPPSERTLD